MSPYPAWYDKLEDVIDELQKMKEGGGREIAVLITMLEQARAWAYWYLNT